VPAEEQPDVEEREVRSCDPDLSPDVNQRLTDELRDTLGTDRVRVPADRPHVSEGHHESRPGAISYLNLNRLTFLRSGLIALTFGAILALISNTWWVLPLAAGIHALGTMTVTLGALHLTTVTEHPSPTLAAAMNEQGISNSDEHFTRLVEEFQPETGATATDVVTPGGEARTASASADPARASAEQSGAMTPTAEPSEPAEAGALPDYLNWGLIAGLAIVSLIIPPLAGTSWMWLLPAVVLPTLGVWAWLQWAMQAHPERLHRSDPATLSVMVLGVTVAVAAFCAVIAVGLHSAHG
jgi:hypothetical protein